MILSRNIDSLLIKYKKVVYILLSFIIPVLVLVLCLIALHITPFGDHNLGISDGKGYVYGLVSHARFLKEVFHGKADWLYGLGGLGGNAWAGCSWGEFNPVKLLSVFCIMETAPDWMTWISVVNFSVCGLTMYILLAYIKGHKFSNLIFSTSYAMIGFNVAYCYHMLFFIGPQLLPLMILGLSKLLKGHSPLVYILSLGSCIFFNFYFGFHLCVASLVCFLAYLYVEGDKNNKQIKKISITWFVSSIIAGLLPAFFWLPALKAFSGGGRLDQTGVTEFAFKENMPFIQIFTKLFSGAYSLDEMVNGLPNIFCGILVVALVILFFMNKKIAVKKRKAAGAVLGFYLLTFYITTFTLAMHGGTHTNWFPYRYSYVFSFTMILIASEQYDYLDDITLKDTKRCGFGLFIAALLVFGTSYEYVSGASVILDFSLLLLMWIGFRMHKKNPEKAPKRVLTVFLILIVCANLYTNYILSVYKLQEWELDLDEYYSNVFVNGALIDAVQGADKEIYRLEKEKADLGNLAADSALYGYRGVGASGPTIRAFIHKEACKVGLNWWNMRHWYSDGIPAATDTLLGIRYLISERDLTEEKGYQKRVDIEGTGVYQNHNALSLSILSNSEAGQLELGENLFENLNSIWKSMTGGSENIFTEQKDVTYTLKNSTSNQSITSKELQESVSNAESGKESEYNNGSIIEYTFEAVKDGPIYVFDTSIPESADGLMEPAVQYVGFYHKGDMVTGQFQITSGEGTGELLRGYCVNQAFAYADNDILEKYAKQLNARVISLNMEKDSYLHGSFTASEGQRILFTIPWDEGWTCYIDGQKVNIDKTWNLFMSVEVPEGTHTWEMKFFPAWMNYGLMISGAAFVGLVVFMILWKKKNRPENIDEEIVEDTDTEVIS